MNNLSTLCDTRVQVATQCKTYCELPLGIIDATVDYIHIFLPVCFGRFDQLHFGTWPIEKFGGIWAPPLLRHVPAYKQRTGKFFLSSLLRGGKELYCYSIKASEENKRNKSTKRKREKMANRGPWLNGRQQIIFGNRIENGYSYIRNKTINERVYVFQ